MAGGSLRVPVPPEAGRFYRHGWHSWSPTGWVDRHRRPERVAVMEYRTMGDDPAHADDDHPGGSAVGAVEVEDGEAQLLGALGLDAWVRVEGRELVGEGDGEWFTLTGEPDAVFRRYADQLGHLLGARPSDPGPIWSSWYGFYRDVSEDSMGEVLAGLGDLPFTVVQVDDGWQRGIGDWQAGAGFPSGMPALAERISATGRAPGLWLAPFLTNHDSALARERPELLLRDGDGVPVAAAFNWGGIAYALDVTRADAVEAVAETIHAVRNWGYSFLKLDFLYAAALPGRHQEPAGRESAYRRAIAAIRQAAGDDAYLLACGAPVVASLGVFDAIRVGPDAAPYWENADRVVHLHDRSGPGAADAIATSLNRLWVRDVITPDPDVAFFRSRACLLSPAQRRLTADLGAVCGFRATSDPPMWLDPDERAELERFLVERPEVHQIGRYRFLLGGREVDFTEIVEARPW
jgi:alpha-galactosidase